MIKYRIICPLNDNLTAFRVKCTEDDKLYIKKILDRPQFEIYKIIQDKDYDGVPKIKELFYTPENDKYILYEECVPGYTIDELFKKGTQFSKKFVIKMATALCNILKPIHNDNLIHRDISPNNVMSIPGNPKSMFGSPANASGRNSNIRYLNTVIRLLTITNRPPSRTHLEAPGCLSAKFCHRFFILLIVRFHLYVLLLQNLFTVLMFHLRSVPVLLRHLFYIF